MFSHTLYPLHKQWYYFFCFRNVSPNKYATSLKWAVTPPGKKFLMSAQWASDVKLGSKLYVGAACKQGLCCIAIVLVANFM